MLPQTAPSHASLTPFSYHNQPVRTMQHGDGTTWWVAADVCAVLGLRNPSKVCSRLEAGEKAALTLSYTPTGQQEILIVNEPGLYRLIMRSRKKEAKEFQHWVFHEVLPQIRIKGSYGQTSALDHFPELRAIVELASSTAEARLLAEAAQAEATQARIEAARAEGKANMALAEARVMTLEEFVLSNGLLRQLPPPNWQSYAHWLREFCQVHGLSIRKDPVPGRAWAGENAYPITALGALVRYEQTRPRQVALVHPSRHGV